MAIYVSIKRVYYRTDRQNWPACTFSVKIVPFRHPTMKLVGLDLFLENQPFGLRQLGRLYAGP